VTEWCTLMGLSALDNVQHINFFVQTVRGFEKDEFGVARRWQFEVSQVFRRQLT
jgi:hypothetical protein